MKNPISPVLQTWPVFVVATLIILSFTVPLNAQSPTAPALGFNVFVKNGATLVTNETEGPVAMGGNLTLAGSYQVALKSAGTFKSKNVAIGLLVGGKVVYGSGNQTYVNNGYVKIGDCTGTKIWYKDNNNANSNLRITNGLYNANPSINLQTSAANLGVSASINPVCEAGLINFAAAFSAMQTNSKNMSAYATNIEFTNPNGNRKGTAIPSVLTSGQIKVNLKTGTNVMNVTGTELNSVTGNITFNNPADANHVLVINVNAAGTYSWNVWNQAGVSMPSCPYIIYNFYNTTSLQIKGNGAVEGTVFAPFADINKTSNQSNIEGQVIGLSYYHSGGENHYANFLPMLAEPDTDGDGVPDKDDNYPKDAGKAFNNRFPATGFNTLLYEDLWPYTGDYDFNDLVLDYSFNTTTNATNNVAEIEYQFVPRAAGAGLKNGFAFQLDGIRPDKIVSVSGTKMSTGWSPLNGNGTEAANTANANIIVFENAFKIFNNVATGGGWVNTYPAVEYHKADTIKVVVKFVANAISYQALKAAQFNPYLITDQTRGREVHLPDRLPSAKMDPKFFGLGADNSTISTGKYFKNKNNLPWALNITGSIPYPQEQVDFTKCYLNFVKWAGSAGTTNSDWYLNNPGFRDATKLYLSRF